MAVSHFSQMKNSSHLKYICLGGGGGIRPQPSSTGPSHRTPARMTPADKPGSQSRSVGRALAVLGLLLPVHHGAASLRERRLHPGGGLTPRVAQVRKVGQVQRDVRRQTLVHARLLLLPGGEMPEDRSDGRDIGRVTDAN